MRCGAQLGAIDPIGLRLALVNVIISKMSLDPLKYFSFKPVLNDFYSKEMACAILSVG